MPAKSIDDRRTCDEGSPAAVQPLPPNVSPGASVMLRGRRCRLDTTVTHPDCRELHVTRTTDGRQCVLLWPFDRPRAIQVQPQVRAVRLKRWSAALLHRASLTIDPTTPRASPATVDIVPFQLAPAIAVAAGACRILLADEVGLGKTIQAGWIVADVIARDPGARVLLAVPAGLRRQWAGELSTRFTIDAAVTDARWMRSAIADLPADVSPWTPPGVYIGSVDFLKRPDVAASIALQVWDLLVIDEAHAATAPTDRHAALAPIAGAARRVIAITATPYSGDRASYASLTAIGAPRAADPLLMFRRSRVDVGDPRRRRHHFARVRITRAEAQLQRLLERYSRDVWNESVRDRDGARLAVTILRKRALSSPSAAARSLRRRLELLQGRAPFPRQQQLFDDEDPLDDDVPPAALASPGLADTAREHRCLASLIAAAEAAHGVDSKLRYLLRLIARLRGESIVIFTEYRDTLLQLAAALPPTLQLHGGLAAAERSVVQERFNREGGLLLATDAAAEGLNLHHRCRVVVNYELPWNPARLEQRLGRVDRIGQRLTVHALTLTARDTAEDLVIRNIARRLSRIVAALGPDDRLGAFLNDARTAGIVIGGDAIDDGPRTEAADMVSFARDDDNLERAAGAAAQLVSRRSTAGLSPRRVSDTDILVSHLRARPGSLSPGYVVVVTCAARTVDGFLAAGRQFVLHLSDDPGRPLTARAARIMAEDLLREFDLHAAVPAMDRWFTEVQEAHGTSVRKRLSREVGINDHERRSRAIQQGLFDRRALLAAERMAASDSVIVKDHSRHLDALGRTQTLHLVCAPSAVLIVWR